MSSSPGHEIRVVCCLFAILFLGVADNQILSPLLPAIREAYGKSSYEVGLLFTAYALSAGFSVLIWGPLSDRFGRKAGLVAGLTLFALGSALSFSSRSFDSLMSGRILTGSGASMLSLNAISYAADHFPYESRGWAMGSIVSSYFAALILGVPFGSWVGEHLGWQSIFGVAGGTAVGLLGTTLWMLPSLATRHTGHPQRNLLIHHLTAYLGFLRGRESVGALASSFFASAGTMGFLAYVGVWLHDSFSASLQEISYVFLASGAAALVASPFAGSLSDRVGKKPQFVLSALALAFWLLLLPGVPWGPMMLGVFIAISLSAAFRQGPMEALMTEVVAPGRRGTFLALKNAFSQLGIGVSALASGYLFDYDGYGAVCILGASFNLAAAAGMILGVRRKNL